MTVLRLALADLWADWVYLLGAVAVIAGVVVPLALLLGVRGGVVAALMAELQADPETLAVTIPGDHGFTQAEAAEVRGWPETGFVALDIRAIARRIDMQAGAGGRIRRIALIPGGVGDPLHPPGVAGLDVVLSAGAAERLGAAPGTRLVALARRGDPATDTLQLSLGVAAVLPAARLGGDVALMDPGLMERIEAFYDGYALPDLGVAAGRDPGTRQAVAESLRLYARDLRSVAALERRVETRFDIDARSRAAAVESTLRLGANLGLALALVAAAGLSGLAAALTAAAWAAVARKRGTLAMLAVLGLTPGQRALFPVAQAAVTALAGGALSLGLLAAAAAVAQHLFAAQMPPGARVVALDPATLAAILAGVLGLGTLTALAAARAAGRIDPGTVLREGAG